METKVRMSRRLAPRTIALVGLMLLVAAPVEPGRPIGTATPDGAVDAADNARAIAYWTEERLRTSQPARPTLDSREGARAIRLDEGGEAVEVPPSAATTPALSAASGPTSTSTTSSASSSEGYWQGSNTANPNRQIGRLFFQGFDPVTRTWKNYNCSGTVVNAENKSVVWTAGHCVYQTFSNTWNRNYVFCPGYRNGSCPFGKWTPYWQVTTTQWQNATCDAAGRCNQTEFQFDLGALKMNTLNGVRIANHVGAHGISFNGPVYQFRYLFGYPLNKTSGQYLYQCSGTNTYNSINLRVAPCGAGGGASGGPWLSQVNSSWLGIVHSVNSHGDDTWMGGPYQGNVAQKLFTDVRY